MSPWSLAKSGSEHGEQSALFSWLAIASRYGFKVADDPLSYTEKGYAAANPKSVAMPDLDLIFAIPNGGSRGSDKRSAQIVGSQMKAEGVKRGVSDIFVPIPRHGLHGLFVEMKRADGGTVSAEQKTFGAGMQRQGYGFVVCYGWLEAAQILKKWLS